MFGSRRGARIVPSLVGVGVLAVSLVAVPAAAIAWLGVHIEEEIEHSEGGARVTRVVEDSPADAAGFRAGDVIVEFDGQTVRGPGGLRQRVTEAGPGRTVGIVVLRDGARTELLAEMVERPVFGRREIDDELRREMELRRESMDELRSEMHQLRFEHGDCDDGDNCRGFVVRWSGTPLLGIEPVQTTSELRIHLGGTERAGLLVGKVLPEMPAGEAGIEVGDLIVAIEGAEIDGVAAIRKALRDRDGEVVRVDLIRDGSPLTIDVELPELDEESGHRRLSRRSSAGQAERAYARELAETARERNETFRDQQRLLREEMRMMREEARRSSVTLL